MKTYVNGLVVVVCVVGSLFMNVGCTESDLLPEENKSDGSLMTRANVGSPYYFYDHENNKVYLALNTENEVYLDQLKSIPAFDYKIFNNTAYDLGGIYINLTGKIGGSSTTLFSSDPGMVSAGDTMDGFLNSSLGYPLSAPPGTPITNLNLEFYAYNNLSQIVEVSVRIDNGPRVYGYVTFNQRGNTIRIALPNSTVPSASRRTVSVEVYRP